MNNSYYQLLSSIKIVYFVNKNRVRKIIIQKKKYKKKKKFEFIKLTKLIILKKIPRKEVLLPLKIKQLIEKLQNRN